MEGSKGSLLGWAELPVTEMESPEQASCCCCPFPLQVATSKNLEIILAGNEPGADCEAGEASG